MIKKFALMLSAVALLASSAHALDQNNPFKLHLGLGGFYKNGLSKDQSNTSTPALKKNQKGFDVILGLSYLKADAFYGDLQFDYRGYKKRSLTVDGTKILKGSDMFYDAMLRLGYAFGTNNFAFTPFFVAGYTANRVDLSQQSVNGVDIDGILLKRKWGYAGVGMRLDGSLNPNWDIGLIVQVVGQLSKPDITTNLTEAASGASSALKWRAKRALNYSAEVPITYNFSRSNSSLRLTPFFKTERVGKVVSGPTDIDGDSFSGIKDKKFQSGHLWGLKLEYLYSF